MKAIVSHTTNAGFSGNGSTYMLFLGLLKAHKNYRQTVKCYRTRKLFLLVGTECTEPNRMSNAEQVPQLLHKWSWEFVTEMR
jgi:hypothetical protein